MQCNEMDVIEWSWSKSNQIPLTFWKVVCTHLFSAFYAYSRSAKSFRDFKQRSMCDGVKQPRDVWMQFQSVPNFHLFTYSFSFIHSFIRFLICSFLLFLYSFLLTAKQQSQSFSVCVCAFAKCVLNHRKPKLISPATAGIFTEMPQRCKWITSVFEDWLVRLLFLFHSLALIAWMENFS